jgi:hypothetical protein
MTGGMAGWLEPSAALGGRPCAAEGGTERRGVQGRAYEPLLLLYAMFEKCSSQQAGTALWPQLPQQLLRRTVWSCCATTCSFLL